MINPLDLWRMAPPPAPETPALRTLRMKSLSWCMAAMLMSASLTYLLSVTPWFAVVIAGTVLQAIVVTAHYWIVKERADRLWSDRRLEEMRAADAAVSGDDILIDSGRITVTPAPEPEIAAARQKGAGAQMR